MRFENVCIESLAVALPEEVWTSADIEEQLRPLYERLKLPFGRLELMTGIKARRVWPAGTRPSNASAAAGKAVLAKSALKPEQVELFMHSAVCRDMLEPATASFAHRAIGLPGTAQIFDVSNACLGFLNALTIAAGLIESGQIRCALVASGENGRPLVEQTLKTLLTQPFNRNEIKPYFANLTIGSGAVAAMVCHRSLVKGPHHRLLGGIARAATLHLPPGRQHAPQETLRDSQHRFSERFFDIRNARQCRFGFASRYAVRCDRRRCREIGRSRGIAGNRKRTELSDARS